MSESFDWLIEPILLKLLIFFLGKVTTFFNQWVISLIHSTYLFKNAGSYERSLMSGPFESFTQRFFQNTESFRNETERMKMHIGQFFSGFVWIFSLAEITTGNIVFENVSYSTFFNRTTMSLSHLLSKLLNYLQYWTTAFLLWIRSIITVLHKFAVNSALLNCECTVAVRSQ